MTERGKFAIPPKTIAAVTPDKGAIMFKVFVTNEDGMKSFVSGKNAELKFAAKEEFRDFLLRTLIHVLEES